MYLNQNRNIFSSLLEEKSLYSANLSRVMDKRALRTARGHCHFLQRTNWPCITGDASPQTQLCSLCWGWCQSLPMLLEMEHCMPGHPTKIKGTDVLPGQYLFRKWEKYCRYKNMPVSKAAFTPHRKYMARIWFDKKLVSQLETRPDPELP